MLTAVPLSQRLEHTGRSTIRYGGPGHLCFDVRREQVILQNCTEGGSAIHQQHWDHQEVSDPPRSSRGLWWARVWLFREVKCYRTSLSPWAELSGLALRSRRAVKPTLQPSYPPASRKVLISQVSVSLSLHALERGNPLAVKFISFRPRVGLWGALQMLPNPIGGVLLGAEERPTSCSTIT